MYPFVRCILILVSGLIAGLISCTKNDQPLSDSSPDSGFKLLSPEITGVQFVNNLEEGPNTNILMYEYFYNGGGVATGDFNDDGLIDLYFTSNMGENKLYLNLGGMKFRDVTAKSGVGGRPGPWKTGVTAVDINGDRKLDLYVSYSGALPPEKRTNQLFINEGNDQDNVPKFLEQAHDYGLASSAFSNQGYFFDYDRDQDLDLLLLNHNPKSLPVLNEKSTEEFLKIDDPLMGVRLYQQGDGVFEDVTTHANISGSALTYGLGIGISDLNGDGWLDFYISNDYAVPDYLYLNNQDGTFSNHAAESLGHISHFSMGNDIADVNNDGRPDIYTLDMLPEDNQRQKLLLSPDNYEKFNLNLRTGFHYQYMRNMLHLNSGDGSYQEIGQLAGVSNTDWSWAALLADYNNDGWKDLFVTNGYYRDYTNLDFINYMNSYTKAKGRLTREDVLEIIKAMPSSNVSNYLFFNQGGYSFTNHTDSLGLNQAANSNGAAYADLDNDGDLDLVVNNINQPAFIYENHSQELNNNHYLNIVLVGSGKNTQGIGAKVVVYSDGKTQVQEQLLARGYLSSVSPVMTFGMGKDSIIDSLVVRWNSGKVQRRYNLETDQTIQLIEDEAVLDEEKKPLKQKTIFSIKPGFVDHHNPKLTINDFKRQSLLITQPSYQGPALTKGDLNGDGLWDLVIAGELNQPTTVFMQQPDGNFKENPIPEFSKHSQQVDGDLAIFDANGDDFPDLYVASGGYHQLDPKDTLLQHRLYFNDQKGGFIFKSTALPTVITSSSCVTANDMDSDGDLDLFVGGRIIPGRYPEAPRSYVLVNDGTGKFQDRTNQIASELRDVGMVTDAIWFDLNLDGSRELIVVGEWLPILVYEYYGGKLENRTDQYFDKSYVGWWNTVEIKDLNQDGFPDLIAGNIGLNTQFNISDQEPAEMYFADFDKNGSVDPIFCFYIQGKSYPFVTRDELLGQLVHLKPRFTSYESYAGAGIEDIFPQEDLAAAKKLTANHMETTLFFGSQSGKFNRVTMPLQTQYAPVHSIQIADFTGDGKEDLLLLGNDHNLKLRLGKSDANLGCLLAGDSKGNFQYINQLESGLSIKGAVRSSVMIDNNLILGINQGPIAVYEWEVDN